MTDLTEQWVNIYKSKKHGSYWTGAFCYKTKEEAVKDLADREHYLTTVNIEDMLQKTENVAKNVANENSQDLTEQEIWKSMSEFDNEYEVSNLGRFRSVDRVIIRKGSQARIKGIIIKGQQDAYGYVTMTIKKKQVKAHRLVAKYFVENPLNKNQVNHKNGIKNDNRAVNLEWCSHEENMKHLYLTMPFEHKNSKQKRMEREDLIRKLTQFVESKTIEDVKNSWVSAKNILDVLCVKYNKINIPMFYEEWQAKLEQNAQLKELLKECEERLIYCTISTHDVQTKIDEVLKCQ